MAEMLIGGERAGAADTIAVVDPATEQELDRVPRGGRAEVDRAVQAASAAFASWSRTDPGERAAILRAGADAVEAETAALVDSLVHEQGKPPLEARGELSHFLGGLRYCADLATKLRGWYQPLPSTFGPAYGLVVRRPIGVVGAIVPWNFPLTLLANKIGPALAAGNTVVAKPAETTPLTTLRVAELLIGAGLPAGVLNVVTGYGVEAGEALASHPLVRRVAFTGQTSTGRRIMELAGPRFARVSLELGGSDPTIVCPDADLDEAAKSIAIGRYWNAGQACLAPKRAYVFDEVYDAFLDKLAGRVSRYQPGPGWVKAEKPHIRVGPLHMARQRDVLADQLADAVDRGAKVVVGGGVPEGRDTGHFFEPTIVVDAPHDSRVVREETFGPVLPVFRVADLDEAIGLANDSDYGLGSSIWTTDAKAIHRATQEIEAGITWVNQLHYGYDEMPFGGVKGSGVGKEHGVESLDEYVELKSAVVGGLG